MASQSNNSYHRLSILDGLEFLHAKNHAANFPFHTHQTFNITLVLEQVFSTRLPNRLLHAPAGSIVITNPDEVHATICEPKIGSSFFTFYIAPAVMSRLNSEKPVFFEDKIIYDISLFAKLHALSKRFGTQINLETELLLVLQDLIANHANERVFSERHTELFQDFLKEEAFTRFSLEKTAALFGLDKYKFLRLFKHETGLTPNNYVILKRIEQAKTLLHTTDDLLDIAIETGFYDATHFCKHFKKFTGITPTAYRNA